MNEETDPRDELLEMLKQLPPERLAEINEALLDAIISAARGEPSLFPVNEMVYISQEEARRLCVKIGLDWKTGKMHDDHSQE